MRAISEIGKILRFVFGLQFAVLAMIVVLSFWGVTRLIEEASWVSHSHQVMATLSDSMVDHGNIKVNTRSYLLVGGQHFLTGISASHERLSLDIDKLLVLTRDNVVQQQNVNRFRESIESHLAFSRNVMRVSDGGWRDRALDLFRDGTIEDMSRRVEAEFRSIQDEEDRLLRLRNDRLGDIVNGIYAVAPLIIVLELFSVVMAYVTTTKVIDKREDEVSQP